MFWRTDFGLLSCWWGNILLGAFGILSCWWGIEFVGDSYVRAAIASSQHATGFFENFSDSDCNLVVIGGVMLFVGTSTLASVVKNLYDAIKKS